MLSEQLLIKFITILCNGPLEITRGKNGGISGRLLWWWWEIKKYIPFLIMFLIYFSYSRSTKWRCCLSVAFFIAGWLCLFLTILYEWFFSEKNGTSSFAYDRNKVLVLVLCDVKALVCFRLLARYLKVKELNVICFDRHRTQVNQIFILKISLLSKCSSHN